VRNAGSYRPVETKKVDFVSLPDFDYARTRLIDATWGYEADRAIVYVKDAGLFVVFDLFKSRVEEYFTLANLWHTRTIHARGEHWYDTGYDAIGTQALPDSRRLLVLFPQPHFRLERVEPIRRHVQDEQAIAQLTGHHFEIGGRDAFVTVLAPHAREEAPSEVASRVSAVVTAPGDAGVGIRIRAGAKTITVGVKTDLRMDIARDFRRPRYLYEKGKIGYGPFETDADLFYGVQEGRALTFTAVNATRVQHRARVLFQAGYSYFGLAFDGSPDTQGVGKVRYWRDTVTIDDGGSGNEHPDRPGGVR